MYYGSHVEADTKSTFRLIKYNAPPSNEEGAVGLEAHTDKDIITILCQNEVQGLEINSREGIWSQVTIPKGCFTVIVGEALKVWSNGRLHAVKHKVTLSGDEDRYTLGCFLLPKQCIEVPREMVDEDHPLLYRPFTFSEYISFFLSCKDADKRDKALELYAGA
ncbi:hypothetical protein RJ640_028684 [Escallonia rubra]|uniref:Fe2OG dioxygenase domain-containing protein n=1 Tax=Escallonia rubra TaxID=112253 RepID=A0AA88RQE3_9ASTE|nr:hypothetical protein RJ640_028684 [Escallonia rubra]